MIDLAPNADQTGMLAGAVAMLAERSPVSRLRPGGSGYDAHCDLAEWGWFGVGLSEADGGLGLGIGEEALLAFEAGRYLLSPSVIATTLAAQLFEGEQRRKLLAGELRAALGFASGSKIYGLDRGDADILTIFDGGVVCFAPSEAFSGQAVAGFDETVSVEAGQLERSAQLSGMPAESGRLLVAAYLAGVARASCDLAVEYAKIREQFGQPIGAFQAIKHICADMAVRAYAAEAQVKLAAVTAADTPASASSEFAAAALVALRAARANSEDAIQVHGGIGFTAECDAHLFLKRSHLFARVLGGLDQCRRAMLP